MRRNGREHRPTGFAIAREGSLKTGPASRHSRHRVQVPPPCSPLPFLKRGEHGEREDRPEWNLTLASDVFFQSGTFNSSKGRRLNGKTSFHCNLLGAEDHGCQRASASRPELNQA